PPAHQIAWTFGHAVDLSRRRFDCDSIWCGERAQKSFRRRRRQHFYLLHFFRGATNQSCVRFARRFTRVARGMAAQFDFWRRGIFLNRASAIKFISNVSDELSKLKSRHERLQLLYHVSNVIHSTLDSQEALQLIVSEAVRLMNAASGSVVLINPT